MSASNILAILFGIGLVIGSLVIGITQLRHYLKRTKGYTGYKEFTSKEALMLTTPFILIGGIYWIGLSIII